MSRMVFVAVVDHKGRILVAPRGDKLTEPGSYMMPGGVLDPEDFPRYVAERELLYLAGIYTTPGMVVVGSDDEVMLFGCAYDGKHTRADPENLDEWEWIEPEELWINEGRHNLGVYGPCLAALDILTDKPTVLLPLIAMAGAIHLSKPST